MDKAKQFLYKIQSKNQLRQALKEKKAMCSKLTQYGEFADEVLILQNEIKIIESELKKFD